MSYYIFGKVQNREVTFVGCTRSEIPADSILLQETDEHAQAVWIKWALRFHRTLRDKKILDHPLARLFKNSRKVSRLLGDENFERYAAEQNLEFLKFHQRNPHVLEKLIEAALEKQAEGKRTSARQLLGDIRWGDIDVDRGDDKVKINEKWSPWYSRVAQMVERRLVGFFAVRSSLADGLVWGNDETWQQFASQHEKEINWNDPFDEVPESADWEYTE